MASITRTAIGRPVATAMLYLMVVVLGLVSLRSLPVDLLPKIEFTSLTVWTGYPNVGPEEIEQIITDPIENAVSGLPNLERVNSSSEEGFSRVSLEFARGTSLDEAANDLRAALDRIRDDLPEEADQPRIWKLDLDRAEVVSLAVTSTRPLDELTRLLQDDLSRRFEQIEGVGTIDIRGEVNREIRVELQRDRLLAANLTALDVQQALLRDNLTTPGGNVKDGTADLYVRATGEYQTPGEIGRTVIAYRAGLPVRVQDVARVHDSYEDLFWMVEVNGMPTVSLGVQKQSGANTVAVADKVRAEVERINAERSDVYLSVISDQSDFIRQSIDSVRTSALWGSLLAVVVLYVFLRKRSSTAIVALAIPISVIASFALLYFGGLTLNQMTFGGLALGVGLIVDNAIVVLESITRKREEEGLDPQSAAFAGTRDVAGAIVASTLTTCVIFLPVVFARTTSGALFQTLALVVVFSLACSLFVALTLVPMLAARLTTPVVHRAGAHAPSDQPRRSVLGRFEQRYTALVDRALGHRRFVFVATALLLSGALLLWGRIPVELAPQTDADEINVSVEMAQGTNLAVAREFLEELEEKARAVLPPDDVAFMTIESRGGDADIEVKLKPQEERTTSASVLADRLRNELSGEVPGARIRVRAQAGMWILRRIFSSGGGDEALQLELRGWDLDQSLQVAQQIESRIISVPGVRDVRVGRREGQPQEDLVFDRERIAELGMNVGDVARTVQANLGGVRAGALRDAGDEVPIVVRLRPEDRLTGQDLRAISLRSASGDSVPLSALVRPERSRAPTTISRVNGQRVTRISANLESGVALGEAVEMVRAELSDLQLPPGFSISFGGEYLEQQEAQQDFVIAILMALVLVYMLMAAQFERLLDPLIVMLSVPMALVGVVPTLLFTGTTLNLQSVMGLVMLVGIVVNNAIVLVDTINLLRRNEADSDLIAVVREACRLRLRPILMTTTTTVLGLLPLAVGIGPGAEIQASLARVVIGGLIASTAVTLVLIPTAYVSVIGLLDRVEILSWIGRSRRGEPAEEVPAAG